MRETHNKTRDLGLMEWVALSAIALIVLTLLRDILFKNVVQVYDAAGHISTFAYARKYWPAPWGFNPQLLGIDFGRGYPPLIEWLMTGLSFIFGASGSYRLVLALSTVSFPLSLIYYFRSLGAKLKHLVIIIILLMSLVMIVPSHFGGSINAVLNLGLITSWVSVPLLFIYMGMLENIKFIDNKPSPKKIIYPLLLLSVIIYSHFVTSLVAILYTVLFILFNYNKIKMSRYADLIKLNAFSNYLILLASASLISLDLYFVYGMFKTISINSTDNQQLVSSLAIGASSLLISVACLLYFRYFDKKKLLIIGSCSLILALIVIADVAASRISILGIVNTISPYRLQVFSIYFSSALMATAVLDLLDRLFKNKKAIIPNNAVAVFSLFVLITLTARSGLINKFYTSVNTAQQQVLDQHRGRFIEAFSRSGTSPTPYGAQTTLVSNNQNLEWTNGLFQESSYNSSFIQSLSKSLNPSDFIEQPDGKIPNHRLTEDKLSFMLNWYGIGNVLKKDSVASGRTVAVADYGNKKAYFTIAKIGETSVVEEISVPMKKVEENDWDKEVKDWWLSSSLVPVPYLSNGSNGQALPVYSGGSNVQYQKISDTRYRVIVESKSNTSGDIPILIKLSFSEHWRAFYDNENKDKLNIFRIAPSLMAVSANANSSFILEYK